MFAGERVVGVASKESLHEADLACGHLPGRSHGRRVSASQWEPEAQAAGCSSMVLLAPGPPGRDCPIRNPPPRGAASTFRVVLTHQEGQTEKRVGCSSAGLESCPPVRVEVTVRGGVQHRHGRRP